jgi:hypothetical protein
MNPRPLDILDLPTLARYRNLVVLLDTARALTRGNPLGAAAFISYFNPARHIYTGVARDNGTTLLGGVIHTNGDSFARLVYLAPATDLTHPGIFALIEHLIDEAGKWGAFHVFAEADEGSDAFSVLRQAGFSVYAWQRIWDVSHITPSQADGGWLKTQSIHLPAVHALHYQIVPPLLQPVEQVPQHAAGFIATDDEKCYVGLVHGRAGILLTPLIHPEATDVAEKLASLLNYLPKRGNRPVYLCVRSYQAWLEPVLEDLGGKPASERQAVMVKHLTRIIKDEQAVLTAQPAAVSVQPSQVSRMESKKDRLG